MSNGLNRWLKEPLLQFLIIGAGIYGLFALVAEPEVNSSETLVVVDAARVEAFASGWQARMTRLPTQEELETAIQQYVKEEILYREAVAMGLGKDDPITRRRLAQKLEFLTKDVARLREPKPAELEDWFNQHRENYRPPELVSFTHVFFDPDIRKNNARDDAEAVLQTLKRAGAPDDKTPGLGDRFVQQSYYPQKTAMEIQRQLGRGFSEQLMQLSPGQWHGPILSGFGVHLVYVHAFVRPQVPPLASVKDQVFEDWQASQMETFNQEYLQRLRGRYEVIIDQQAVSSNSLHRAGAVSPQKPDAPGS